MYTRNIVFYSSVDLCAENQTFSASKYYIYTTSNDVVSLSSVVQPILYIFCILLIELSNLLTITISIDFQKPTTR